MAVLWKMPPHFTTKVVGVSFAPGYPDTLHELHRLYLDAEASRIEGEMLEPIPAVLEREPDNEHDPNAIAVHIPLLEAKIGHLPRAMAERLAPELDAGARWIVGVYEVLLNPHYPDRPGIALDCQRVEEER